MIHVGPNNLSEWHRLVCEARSRLRYEIDENVENYLVLTLDQYATDKQLSNKVIAIEYLKGLSEPGRGGVERLRSTGDRCLILSGFFPERAERFNLDVEYFIEIGQQAYCVLANNTALKYDPELFNKLCDDFVRLTHVLLTMRGCD